MFQRLYGNAWLKSVLFDFDNQGQTYVHKFITSGMYTLVIDICIGELGFIDCRVSTRTLNHQLISELMANPDQEQLELNLFGGGELPTMKIRCQTLIETLVYNRVTDWTNEEREHIERLMRMTEWLIDDPKDRA